MTTPALHQTVVETLAQLAVLSAIGAPLAALAAQFGGARMREWSRRTAPWIPLILLWPAFGHADGAFPWSILGTRLGVDEIVRPILLLVAIAWSTAGWFATTSVTTDRRWFWTAWLGALSGMHLLLLAGDMASFYLGYGLVSFSGYLLVTQPNSREAWRAGRVYLVMALAGEAAILIGLLLVAGALGNASLSALAADPTIVVDSGARWWLFAGFAVKLGILPLHVWLPLAHPVAPVPASAVLSAVIVKAGLMGWLRFVPPGTDDPLFIGEMLLLLGLVTAFGGVVLGLGQERLKTVLAYSTISQMGLVLVGFAAIVMSVEEANAAYAALGIVALHHGLNKAALFVACGCAPGASKLRLTLFALPALSLVAAPLTTGFLAKSLLKDTLASATTMPSIAVMLSLSSTATALLMWKAFRIARRQTDGADRLHPAWPTLVIAALTVPWVYASATDDAGVVFSGAPVGKLVDGIWPLALAAALIAVAQSLLRGRRLRIPEGDLVVPIERALAYWSRAGAPDARVDARVDAGDARSGEQPTTTTTAAENALVERFVRACDVVEEIQRRIPVAGLGLLVIGGVLWLLTLWRGW